MREQQTIASPSICRTYDPLVNGGEIRRLFSREVCPCASAVCRTNMHSVGQIRSALQTLQPIRRTKNQKLQPHATAELNRIRRLFCSFAVVNRSYADGRS